MSSKKLVAVTIPIYKNEIDQIELISLSQCVKVLGNHPIIFFAPISLDTSFYEEFCEGKVNYSIERFDDSFFSDIKGYNRLMLSKSFYQRFVQYYYILIYQLDAYVFRDELVYWCNNKYTYLAAPSINVTEADTSKECSIANDGGGMKFLSRYKWVYFILNKVGFKGVGFKHIENGGFSLRKVSHFILLLSFLKGKADKWNINEDTFYTYWLNVFFFVFKLPEELVALRFSFEKNPNYSYQLTNYNLPFGCHAFELYDKEFWQKFINV